MKTLKFVLIPVLISLLLFGCKAEPLDGDEDAPVIEVLAPSDNPVFYVSGSQSTPNTLQIRARATDNNAVVFGILTVEDANGDLVDADVESSFSENNTVMELLANFSTDTPGTYKLNFLFRDANDNNASITRTVECLAGTDEQAEEEEEEVEQDACADILGSLSVFFLHGGMSQPQRTKSYAAFKKVSCITNPIMDTLCA